MDRTRLASGNVNIIKFPIFFLTFLKCKRVYNESCGAVKRTQRTEYQPTNSYSLAVLPESIRKLLLNH